MYFIETLRIKFIAIYMKIYTFIIMVFFLLKTYQLLFTTKIFVDANTKGKDIK
ncbi:hypothetical protein GCM10025767_31150 [Thalassotalea piscium]